ncbi:MAG TPA: translation initiation factor IF-2 [Candidatus Binatia bacterium]|jgi:translation initiation factor IF-2|nr:translation initiation factor IF-2 [Candidatus Binatia bacterium]
MVKTRVHILAKDLGMESKDLIGQLEKLGIRGKKTQSSLEDEEVARVRAALAASVKPQVVVGGEKIVADRVVTAEDQNLGEIQAREQVVERRVRTNVIRRRTSRLEVISQTPAAKAEPQEPAVEEGRAPESAEPAAQGVAARVERSKEEKKEGVPGVEARAAEPLPVAPAKPEAPQETVQETPKPAHEEAPRGARVLGRIDLKRAARTEPPVSVPRRPAPVEVVPPPLPRAEVQKEGPPKREGAPETAEEGKPTKAVRHKKRVIKKQDLPDVRDREFRSGRIPKKKRALPGKEQKKTEITVPKASKRVVKISEVVSVGDLARMMGVKTGEVIKKLMGLGMMATINQMLDVDTATLIASEFDHQIENVAFDVETALEVEHQVEDPEEAFQPRPPVVTIMGHVDHGKTSLLDVIRSTNVTAQEAGGITQHIGAYHVPVNGRSATFLDTPGHEAFTAMRARGAKVTDIVVLVVAADDGVMPQTVEAINHARAADVPIIVAINKIDRPDADIEKVKRGLADYGLVSEEWGGDAIFVPVSAKTKEGIPQLLEMILLQADVLELRANPQKLARGTIIEAKLDRGRGPVATVLVQEGTLKIGDAFVCGVFQGRVRAMIDDRGSKLDEAPPALPVEILGFQGVPQAGDPFVALNDEAKARQVAEYRQNKQREAELVKTSKVSLEDLYDQIKTGDVKELRIVLKADVHGSVEAMTETMNRLSNNEEVKLRVIHGSVGGITESDVLLAAASNAIVIGFNVRPETKAANLAVQEGVDVRLYTIIYDAIADIRAAMEGLLEPTYREQVLGRVEVREIFNIHGIGTVAGCYVNDGKIQRSNPVRLLRDHAVVHEGKLASLKRFKDDVREVSAGYECGIGLEGFQDVKKGDVIEAFERVPVIRRITPSPGGREASRVSAGDKR